MSDLGQDYWHKKLRPVVKLSGATLDETSLDALVMVKVELGYRVAGRATLRFADPAFAFASTPPAFADPVVVTVDGTEVFSGKVTGFGIEARDEFTQDFVVVAHDSAYALARSTKVRSLSQQSVSNVVSTIAGECGMTASCSGGTHVYEGVFHAGTALELLDELTAREGLDWWVTGTTLHVAAPPSSGATVTLTRWDVHSLSVRASALPSTKTVVTGWDPATKKVVTGEESSGSPDAASSNTHTPTIYAGTRMNVAATLSTTVPSPTTQAEAKNLAKAYQSAENATALTVRGVVTMSPSIALGGSVQLTECGPANGTYPVTEVEHVWTQTSFRTTFSAGERRPTSLADSLGGRERSTLVGRSGLVVGIVTNNKDPKSWGRVKVKFPTLDDAVETDWARVATPGGGKSRGVFFVPEVNDEVLVAFENGDLRRPVVLGGLFNGQDPAPSVTMAGDDVQTRTIKSRKGYVVEFSDGNAPADQYIKLQLDTTDSKVRLGKDKVEVEAPSGTPISVKSGQGSIDIGNDGSVTIKGTKVTIQATGQLSIEGQQTAVKGTQTEVTATGTLTVKSNGLGELSATGPLTVKGAMVSIN